jgi:ParB family chromosome partitioning protein
VIEALRKLFAEHDFVALLEAERLDTLPKNLAQRMQS